jgi:hypothetical protein
MPLFFSANCFDGIVFLFQFDDLGASKSELHQPLFELMKQVRLYEKPWNVNRLAMLELEKDYQRHYYILDAAIRKLEGVESRAFKMKAQRNLSLWEKLALRVLVRYD